MSFPSPGPSCPLPPVASPLAGTAARRSFPLPLLLLLAVVGAFAPSLGAEERTAVEVFGELVLAEDDEVADARIEELGQYGDPVIAELYGAWRKGDIFVSEDPGLPGLIVERDDGSYANLALTEELTLSEAQVDALDKRRASRGQRRAMSEIVELLGLKAADPAERMDAAREMGLGQDEDVLPALRERLGVEENEKVRAALEEAIALSLLANGDADERLRSVQLLGERKSMEGRDFIRDLVEGEIAADRAESALAVAGQQALDRIERAQKAREFWGSFARGFSLGSVLLIVAFGLAITFGLMGIINMAHGELVAVGGYTTFLIQTGFLEVFGLGGGGFGLYLLVSLPASFLVGALFGLFLEKTVIRFLYRRPLESLLCTWGLSMILQQVFRLIFGASNVQVNNPGWLSGNLTMGPLSLSYTRVFIILVAFLVILLTWYVLRRTHLGLHIRAVMQNRDMARSLGIPVARVNALTFAFGAGLAAVGGSVLSQIGNVGPTMGQAYLVDSFMVVVIGSLGNLLGAGLSALGIGLVDQLLQPSLGPVLGKITVFFLIILFLQWRPGGLFPTKSRSLDD